jgi:uncharacterized protein (TIGR02646 family)
MINVTKTYILTQTSIDIIDEHRRINRDFNSKSWSLIHKSVKNEISTKIFDNHGFKCIYCERDLIGLGNEMDHFAHKGDYPKFTFIPENIFYSCKFCNSTSRKGQKNTVKNENSLYNRCDFLIVHPFFDNPDNEIKFLDDDRIFFDRPNCSKLGRDTIDFFRWDDLVYTTIRSRTLINERLNPLTSTDEKILIQEAITYK